MIEDRLPAAPGSYLLWFFVERRLDIEVGRLGRLNFRRGWYGYCGSAFGPGGLRARLCHHLRRSPRRHWHIDYLKEHAVLKLIWLHTGSNCEHLWSGLLLQHLGYSAFPHPHFGASDCDCHSHMVYCSSERQLQGTFHILRKTGPIRRLRNYG